MKAIEMKKVIKARAGLKNYSAITNIKWECVRGIGATAFNCFDDIITFIYKNCKYRLESKFTSSYSADKEHKLIIVL